jgi:hypothetical protein
MAAFIAWLVVEFGFGAFAISSVSAVPQPEYGKTFLIHFYGRPWVTGYVEPWIGKSCNQLFTITLVFLCVTILIVIANGMMRMKAGLPFKMGDNPPAK